MRSLVFGVSGLLLAGVQVVRGRGTKLLITRTATVTIWPDGHAERGVPKDRADLRALEARLKEPLDVVFLPIEREMPDAER